MIWILLGVHFLGLPVKTTGSSTYSYVHRRLCRHQGQHLNITDNVICILRFCIDVRINMQCDIYLQNRKSDTHSFNFVTFEPDFVSTHLNGIN